MKKKLLALFLALCTAVSLLAAVPAAAADNTGALQTIRALGIIQGDTSGNLNLEGNVTRAQFAKMIVSASSYKDSISGSGSGYSLFKDVKSSYWASEYIKIAVQEGWMTGYTDGTFRPYSTITLEQACATVLRMLGYTSSTLAGSYPSAQLSKASALGLRDQINLSQGGAMLSVAEIPLCGVAFTGCVGFVFTGGKEYRVATYRGGKPMQITGSTLVLRQGDLTVRVEFLGGSFHPLRAPRRGVMARTIHESAACRVHYVCTLRNRILLDFVSEQASFETNWDSQGGIPES